MCENSSEIELTRKERKILLALPPKKNYESFNEISHNFFSYEDFAYLTADVGLKLVTAEKQD